MDHLAVEVRDGGDGASAFLPGETVEGTASWRLDRVAETAELRLFWYTEGKGDQDVGVVSVIPFANPGLQDQRAFRVTLPDGPFSFSGKLISLAWALELVIEPGSRAGRTEITVSPTRTEILLPSGPSE
jgi:hypothetical protein